MFEKIYDILYMNYNYLGTIHEDKVKAYKYVGKDLSLLYKYIFGPQAQFLVDNFFPLWLAPNLITLIGFQFILIPHLILYYYSPEDL